MRKYYITLAAALFSASVFAQTPFLPFHKNNASSTTNTLPGKKQMPNGQKTDLKTGLGLTNSAKATAFRRAAGNGNIISEQPAGTLYKNWNKYAEGYLVFWGYIFQSQSDGDAQDFVIDNDGNVYLKNPISTLMTNTWIKGYKAAGDTIAFDLPQKVYKEEYEGETEEYSAWRMLLTVVDDPDEGSYKTYVPDSTSQTIKFVLRNDSLFKTEPDVLLGLGTADDGGWTGYGDWTNDINKVTDETVKPANPAAAEQYLITHENSDSTLDYQVGKVAVEGNDIYIGGFSPNQPDAWVKGKIEGNKAIFDKRTYLGVDTVTQAHTYFLPAGREVKYEYFDDEAYPYDSIYAVKDITFDYDAATKSLKSKGGFLVNKGTKTINQQAEYFNPSLEAWQETAGTPDTPAIVDYMAYDDEYEYGGIQFELSKTSTDGKFLNPEKLYYNLYVDDELYTFYPDEYTEFTEEITDLPYNYSGEEIQSAGDSHIIYFFITGFEKMGIQEVYIDNDGTRYPSEIAWINADGTTAIKNVAAKGDGTAKGITYTDLSGRKVSAPTKGLYIKSTTLADGTVKTSKVILK